MKISAKLGLAMTSALFLLATTGCGQDGVNSAGSAVAAEPNAAKSAKAADKAEKYLAKGDLAKALSFAETAVTEAPADADRRMLLGRVYLAHGRFLSAERSFEDAMELGGATARNVVSLALARIGLNKVDSARTLLNNYRNDLPASDYGLAMALIGDTQVAVDTLSSMIRNTDANARTRQNLALAYALNGNWRAAKVMALQDLPQDEVDRRIAKWAMMARPGAFQERVAGVLNVTPQAADPGQPQRLAISNLTGNLAAAPVEQPALSQPVASEPAASLAALGPAPVAGARDQFHEAPKATDIPASSVASPSVPVIAASSEPAKTAPVKLAMADTGAAAPAVVGGTHVVQLGAYSTPAQAKAAWKKLSTRHRALAGYGNANSTVVIKGKTLYRLAAMGFDNAQSAKALCAQIKAQKGACIVRAIAPAGGKAASRFAAR